MSNYICPELNTLTRRFVKRLEYNPLGMTKPDLTVDDLSGEIVRFKLSFDLEREVFQDDWELRIIPSFAPVFSLGSAFNPGKRQHHRST